MKGSRRKSGTQPQQSTEAMEGVGGAGAAVQPRTRGSAANYTRTGGWHCKSRMLLG